MLQLSIKKYFLEPNPAKSGIGSTFTAIFPIKISKHIILLYENKIHI